MASEAQRGATKKNIKKATASAKSQKTISKLPKSTAPPLPSRRTRSNGRRRSQGGELGFLLSGEPSAQDVCV